ncbi:MAG: hypothetical protein JO121_22430 [Deltaproteobacteria bacterium]|nr:hypothetical protein [Deltaproteobacteria bacterium]
MSPEDARHQKPTQLGLPLKARGEAPSERRSGEASTLTTNGEVRSRSDRPIEQVLARGNIKAASARVRENRGSPGVGGERRFDGVVRPDVTAPSPAATEEAEPPAALDLSRERRVKALTCTEPLHSLQTNRGRRGWERFDFYDLGLAAIDAVVDKMGFDTGINREELDAILVVEARRFAPDLLDDNLHAVVTELIETLIRPNIGEYSSALDEVRRRFDFTLLSEHENAEGGIYLRATNEAINVLVGGLNTDIESAQVAAEATLEHLIRRRRLDDAAKPAREAKVRSIQYSSFVRQVIEETKRDIRRAGWRDYVPERLAEIREHLLDRMRTEEKLLVAMQETRDSTGREDLRRQAAALVETVEDCFMRHQELHATALSAIRVYVEEQDRQVFGRAATIGAIDLTIEALVPILTAPLGAVGDLLAAFAERLLGFGPGPRSASIVPRRQPRVGAFIQALLRPPQTREELGPELDELEWEAPPEDPIAFTAELWALADEMLENLNPPLRLSALLAAAEKRHGFDAADLVRLRTLIATAPDLDAVRPGAPGVLAAAGDGQTFQSASFVGDDLVVGALTADEAGYAATIIAQGKAP